MPFLRLFSLFFLLPLTTLATPFSVNDLRCEHLATPLGVDALSPRLSWKTAQLQQQTAYQLWVATDSIALYTSSTLYWQSERKTSGEQLTTYTGPALQPFTRYYWLVKVWDENSKLHTSNVSWFETGFMHTAKWKGAWIGDGHSMQEKRAGSFLKTITATKKIVRARAYISAGGLYELNINGKKAGNERLNPMFTRYDRRLLYVTHDLTDLLQQGNNYISVSLGNGWFNHQPPAVWFFHEAPWRARPRFCMDIHITYEDGSTHITGTDKSWKAYLNDITQNNIYTGEFQDARLRPIAGNNKPVPDSLLRDVYITSSPSQKIVSQLLHPIRDVDTLSAVDIKKIDAHTYLYNFGKNISGVAELQLSGPRGTKVRLTYTERLDSIGKADQSNIDYHYRPKPDSDPFQIDEFILSGNGTDTFRPLFNYKGFQYVQVHSDTPLAFGKKSVKAYFMHSDVPVKGTIHSSNPLINKIWEATNTSYLGNLFGYPTDCPQREKNGWTGDAHIAIETALYNFDGITVYEKWMNDHQDAQLENGILPAIIPTADWGYNWANGPDWTSTIAIIPWNLYLFYGDKQVLAHSYNSMQRYVDYITSISPAGTTDWGLGDWIPIQSVANKELTTSIYYYVDANIMAQAARLLNRTADIEKYSRLATTIKKAINDKFLNSTTGSYANGLQTELSMALYWGIVPEELKARVAANLAAKVKQDGRMDVGLLGSKSILNALSENGYADLAYQLASRETYPSWGWWIKNGATTLYENWRIDAGSDISMNHIMFGEVSAWFYKCLGGIRIDEAHPGFRQFNLQPYFASGLDHFEAKHLSPQGWIRSSWRRQKNIVTYEAEVPANSTATLYLPDGKKGSKTIVLQPGKHQFKIAGMAR